MKKEKLLGHFTKELDQNYRGWVGSEIETNFVNKNGEPITVSCSQEIFNVLSEQGWKVTGRKGVLITVLEKDGAKVLYELGRQNIEIATPPVSQKQLWNVIQTLMNELYSTAKKCGAYPLFEPIIDTKEDLLVIADERDVSWLNLDGRVHLTPLAKTASVQFTFETKGPKHAIELLNKLAKSREIFTEDNLYIQEEIWRTYIQNSNAGYKKNRYGVVQPNSIEQYVDLLADHDVVIGNDLVPFEKAEQENIDLFLRSVWWNFRLRRYSNRLCIEVRIFARRKDNQILVDLQKVLSIID